MGSIDIASSTEVAAIHSALSQGDHVAAYEIAMGRRTALSGDPAFDHAYGIAALRTGHAHEAVFALERVVVNEPENLEARLDLAEAYLALDNRSASAHEIGQASRLQASPAQAARLEELAGRAAPFFEDHPNGWSGDIALSLGYDTNINTATADDLLSLPGVGEISLDDAAQEIDASFVQLGFRLDRSDPLGPDSRTGISIDGYHREYLDNDDYDLTDLKLSAGVSARSGSNSYGLQGRIHPTWRGGDLYRSIYSLAGEVGTSDSEPTSYDLGLQWSYLEYQDTPLYDRQQLLASAGLTHRSLPLIHQAMLYGGTERADEDAGKYNARDIGGITYRLVHSPDSDSRSFVQLFYQYAGHQAADPAYDRVRKDDLMGVSLGHDWRANRDVTVYGRYFYYDNSSNLDLYDYDRHQIQAGVRYRF